jgi:hypothetical protein
VGAETPKGQALAVRKSVAENDWEAERKYTLNFFKRFPGRSYRRRKMTEDEMEGSRVELLVDKHCPFRVKALTSPNQRSNSVFL